MKRHDYFLVALLAFFAGSLGSFTSSWVARLDADEKVLKKPVVEVMELKIVDADGKVVAEMGTIPDAPASLVFRDSAGKIRCGIGFAKDGSSGLELFNDEEVSLCAFGVSTNGAKGVVFRDKTGSDSLSLGISADGSLGLEFFGSENKSLGGLGMAANGEFGLKLADTSGRTRFDLGLTAAGAGGYKILDESGRAIVIQPN